MRIKEISENIFLSAHNIENLGGAEIFDSTLKTLYGEMPALYDDINEIVNTVNIIFSVNSYYFSELLKTTEYTYNPLTNFSSERTTTGKTTGKTTITNSGTSETTNGGTTVTATENGKITKNETSYSDTNSGENTNLNINQLSPFDVETFNNNNKTDITVNSSDNGSGNSTTTITNSGTDTATTTNNLTTNTSNSGSSETQNVNDNSTTENNSGYSGVSPTELLEKQRNYVNFTFITFVLEKCVLPYISNSMYGGY